MVFNIYLTNLLRALSLALELSDGGLSRHHWRTAMIADRIAGYLNLPQGQRHTLLNASLMHDIGAAAKWEEKSRLYNSEPLPNLRDHAEEGYNLLRRSQHFRAAARPVRHHHDRWDGTNGLAGTDIPLLSRIINIADSLEVYINDNIYILDQNEAVLEAIAGESGATFDPELVKALMELGKQESFWFDLSNPHYYVNFFNAMNAHGQVQLNIDDVIEVAEIFATIVDRTSRYTAKHSRSVSEVAAFLAYSKGYSNAEVKAMRIAGLLHDLGKLTVPNTILEKPGKLSPREYAIVKQHTYYSYRILNQIDGFTTIAEWAAYHHETLDGKGYPFRIGGDFLRLGSRIVAVADVFAALTERRPYREALTLKEVEKIMTEMAAAQRLDHDIVKELLSSRDALPLLAEGLPAIDPQPAIYCRS